MNSRLKLLIYKHELLSKIIFILLAFGTIFLFINYIATLAPIQPIKIGILHSRTGPLATNEEQMIDATLLAVQEINKMGGMLGSYIETVIADGKSDETTFAREAERLITEEKVVAIFGCWTSASRKAVDPIITKYKNVLFYPVQFEGLEESPHIVYTGAVPNQQILPAVLWCLTHLGKKVFLVGSDYVYPRSANEILKELLPNLDAQIVGEEYILLGSEDVTNIIRKIEQSKPDFIVNTINGRTNIQFFKELKSLSQKLGKTIPAMSTSISNKEFQFIGLENIAGHYTCWNYFETINTTENKEFVQKMRQLYGLQQRISDPMEAAYFGVYLWREAVDEIQSVAPEKVLSAITKKNITYLAPEGFVGLEENITFTSKKVRIGQVNKEGKNEILWSSLNVVAPKPYPNETLLFKYLPQSKSKEQWNQYLEQLYKSWGNTWSAR